MVFGFPTTTITPRWWFVGSFALLATTRSVANGAERSPSSLISSRVAEDASSFLSATAKQYILQELQKQQHRHLQQEDEDDISMDALTELLHPMKLQLPNFESSEKIGFLTMSLTASNIICYDLVVDEIETDYSMNRRTREGEMDRLIYNLNINNLGLKCDFDFDWSFSLLSDGGSGTVIINDSFIHTSIAFSSPDFDQYAPSAAETLDCDSSIHIDDISYTDNSVTTAILSAFEMIIEYGLENEITDTVCAEFSYIATQLVGNLVTVTNEYINKYNMPVPVTQLGGEDQELAALMENGQVQIINFTNFENDGGVGSFLIALSEEFTAYFATTESSSVSLPRSSTITTEAASQKGGIFANEDDNNNRDRNNNNEEALRINTFLRENILSSPDYTSSDPRQYFELGTTMLSTLFDPFLLDGENGENTILDYTLLMDSIRIYGLDTITKFEPNLNFDNHTYELDMSLQDITIEVYLQLNFTSNATIKVPDSESEPSGPELATLFQDETITIRERVRLELKVYDLDINFGVLAMIDSMKFNELQLQSLLDSEYLMSCILSTFYKMELYKFNISFDEELLNAPTVHGLLSDNIDNVLSTGIEAVFKMYEKILVRDISTILHNVLNNMIASYMEEGESEEKQCPQFSSMLPADNSSLGNLYVQEQSSSNSNEDSISIMNRSTNPYIDFRDLFLQEEAAIKYGASGLYPYGDLLPLVYQLIQNRLFNEHDPITLKSTQINSIIIEPMTKLQSGIPGKLVFDLNIDQGFAFSFDDVRNEIKFELSDIKIDNVDTVGQPLSLLEVVKNEPYILNNTATVGVTAKEDTDGDFRVALQFSLEILQSSGLKISNEVGVTFDINALTLMLSPLMRISKHNFLTFPIRDALNIFCWLATMDPSTKDGSDNSEGENESSLQLRDLALSVSKMKLRLNCISCTSPKMHELVDIVNTAESDKNLTAFVNGIDDYLKEVVGENLLTKDFVDGVLNMAANRCPHHPLYQTKQTEQDVSTSVLWNEISAGSSSSFEKPEVSSNFLDLIIVVIVLGVMVAMIIFFVRFVVRRRHNKWLLSLPKQQLHLIHQHQKIEDEKEAELNSLSASMFSSTVIPKYVRYAIPIIIIGNVGFFLSGHLSIGGAVDIAGQIAGQEVRISNFYSFSIAQSVIDLIDAGGIALAVLILIFAVIWPYTKQIITFTLWFLPPSVCSISLRGSILLWLEVLAKWSMVDIFALVVSLSAFRIQVKSPSWGFLPEDFYEGNLMVVPKWGLYANMTAQLISQISSHFIIYYHRQVYAHAVESHNNIGNPAHSGRTGAKNNNSKPYHTYNDSKKEQLCSHAFARLHRGWDSASDRLVVRRGVSAVLAGIAFVFAIFIFLGCTLPSFTLEMFGLVGVAIEAGQDFEEAIIDKSVFSIIGLIMNQAKLLGTGNDFVGLGVLCALTILCVLIVPLMQTCALMYQWFYPMTEKARADFTHFAEILQSWQYVEVYIISVVVASWQLAPTSEFMINAYCDSLTDSLVMIQSLGFLDSSDAQCFQMNATVGSGAYFLFVCAVLLTLMNTLIMKATTQYFRDKDVVISSKNQYDIVSKSCHHLSVPRDENDGDMDAQEESTNNTSMANIDKSSSREEAIKSIHSIPVLFTDTFRWLLINVSSNGSEHRPSQCPAALTTDLQGRSVDDQELRSNQSPANGSMGV